MSWSVSGLGKRVGKMASSFAPPVLTAQGKKLEPSPQPKGVKSADKTWALARSSEYKTLSLDVVEGHHLLRPG